MPPEWTNTTTVRKSAHQSKRTAPKRKQGFAQLGTTLSLYIQCVPSMYRGRVFIGDGSPTTLRYYTVIPPNNYISGIFSGHNRIFTSLSRLHPGPFLAIGPITAHRAQVRTSSFGEHDPFSASEVLALLRLPLLVFDFANGALAFASLRLPSSSPLAPWSSPFFARLCLRLCLLGLRLSSLGLPSRQKTLSWHSSCARAFGRWPKVAPPTVAPRSHCPSLEGR